MRGPAGSGTRPPQCGCVHERAQLVAMATTRPTVTAASGGRKWARPAGGGERPRERANMVGVRAGEARLQAAAMTKAATGQVPSKVARGRDGTRQQREQERHGRSHARACGRSVRGGGRTRHGTMAPSSGKQARELGAGCGERGRGPGTHRGRSRRRQTRPGRARAHGEHDQRWVGAASDEQARPEARMRKGKNGGGGGSP